MRTKLRKAASWFFLGISLLCLIVFSLSFVRRIRIDTGFVFSFFERGMLIYYDNGIKGIFWGYALRLEPLDPDGGFRLMPILRSVDGSIDLGLPLWIPILLLAAPTLLLWMQPIRSFRRRRKGHCIKCGYPLPSPSHPCPECGTKDDKASTS